MRRRVSHGLDGPWRFVPDPHDDGEEMGFWKPGFDDRDWLIAPVPGVYESASEALIGYTGTAWYRRRVRLPEGWAGRRIVLRFEGVSYRARVWLDGRLLGENHDPFLPFEFRVDALLADGAEHDLAVAVDNAPHEGDVPADQVQWHGFGGILRSVALHAGGWIRVARARIDARPAPGGGRASFRIEAVNETAAPADLELEIVIRDRTDQPVCRLTAAGRTGAGGTVELEAEGLVPDAALWSPRDPALYRAAIRLLRNGVLEDETDVRFGFRRIEATPAGLLLNGEPIFLSGFNRHEDSPATDMASDPATARRDFALMKETGANFVRLCHYPHDPLDLDLCDELGLLALGEIPLNLQADDARIRTAARQLERMIGRDGHHPCLILWSVSNEIREEEPVAAEGNRELIRLARRLDPSRLCVHVSFRWKTHPNFDEDDVICVNDYPGIEGWYGRRGSSPLKDPAFTVDRWNADLAALHARYPDKPILVTEFGYCSFPGTVGHALGEDRHAAMIRVQYPVLKALPYVCGAAVWCWADHPASPHRFLDGLARSPFGVLRRDRKPKQAYGAVRALFRSEPNAPADSPPTR